MKFIRLDLLTLLISLFIFAGCKNPDSIGLGIDPAKSVQGSLNDTTTIKAVTAVDDTVLTSNDTIVPIAFFKDPVLGTTEANLAASLSLPGEAAFTAITGIPRIDSAILVLDYDKKYYGDISSTFTMNVYQLNEPVLGQSYYNNRAWNYNSSALIGTKTFVPKPTDTLLITDIVTGGPDTLKKVVPQLRVPIDRNFINNNFFNATASQLATNQVFENAVKGLFISVNTSSVNSNHPGGTMFFNISSSARIDVYYKIVYTTTNPDTVVTTLPVANLHAVQIKHDYSVNTDIVNQLKPANQNSSYPNVYLQGLAGLRGKISFPYLKGTRLLHDIRKSSFATNPSLDTTSIVDFGINQAQLVVTPVAGTGIPFPPLPRITLYRWDIAHQRTVVPDAYTSDPRYVSVGSFGGFYDTYHQYYSFLITGYVDDLLRGKLVDYGTFIAPADSTGLAVGGASIDVNPSAYFTGRSVVGGNKTSPYKIKLNILYNKVTR